MNWKEYYFDITTHIKNPTNISDFLPSPPPTRINNHSHIGNQVSLFDPIVSDRFLVDINEVYHTFMTNKIIDWLEFLPDA